MERTHEVKGKNLKKSGGRAEGRKAERERDF